MFYNLIYRSPLWLTNKKANRNIKVLVLGSILYISMYAFLQTKYSNISFLENYKKYIYHIFVSDLSTVSVQMYFQNTNTKNKRKTKTQKKSKKLQIKKKKPQLNYKPLENKQDSLIKPLQNTQNTLLNTVKDTTLVKDINSEKDTIIDIPIYVPNNVNIESV